MLFRHLKKIKSFGEYSIPSAGYFSQTEGIKTVDSMCCQNSLIQQTNHIHTHTDS